MSDLTSSRLAPIAVVGLGAMFPGGAGLRSFWHTLASGRDVIREVPPTHWLPEDYFDPDPAARDKVYSRRGAFLEPFEFDPLEFGIPPAVLPATDPAQLLALVVARQALADAQRGLRELDRDRVSVILGVASTTQLCAQMAGRLPRPAWAKALREHGFPEEQVQRLCDSIAAQFPEWQENTFPGLLGNVVAGRIANRLDLGGTNCVVDAACAGTLSALSMAIGELQLGHSDAVITGGVDCLNDVLMYLCFSKTGALSRSEECRPFSTAADGTLLGEGVGMMVLRRLDAAERDGDAIYAVIRGCGSSSDGRAKSIYAPRTEGQVKAYRRAYQQAGYGPESVELVEAHGTGTVAGDAAELAGLREVFREAAPGRRRWCALGSVKSQIGHTKAAAGAAGMIKAILALHQGVLPPTIKVDQPAAELDDDSPFSISTRARPWVRSSGAPRRAAVSAFGFGGANFHVTLEEYRGPVRAPRLRVVPTELVLVGAADRVAAAARCRELAEQAPDTGSLEFVAYESQHSWEPAHSVRLAVVAADRAELSEKLRLAADRLAALPDDEAARELILAPGAYLGLGSQPGKIAFLFPGQGSQYVQMGSDLAMFRPEAAEIWDWAAGGEGGDDERVDAWVFPPTAFSVEAQQRQESDLRQTERAQPALGAASLAAVRVLAAAGIEPELTAGHSFGELAALHAAGVLCGEDLLRAARARGRCMAEAAAHTPGAMTAVNHPVLALRALLEGVSDELVFANRNSPEQVVISGPVAVIEAAEARLAAAAVRFVRLPVSTAFHSPLVANAVPAFATSLAEIPFHSPQRPVIAGSTGEPFPEDPAAIRQLLAEQIARPVRFVDQVEHLYAMGARIFVEVGPGAVLTGLADQCLQGRPHQAMSMDRKGTHGVTSLWHLLGRLAVAGVPVRWAALWEGFVLPEAPRAGPKSRASVTLTGAQYGKPYPGPGDRREKRAAAERIEEAPAVGTAPRMPDRREVGDPGTAAEPARREPVTAGAGFRVSTNGTAAPAGPATPHAAGSALSAGTSAQRERMMLSSNGKTNGSLEALCDLLARTQMGFQESMLTGHREFLRAFEATVRGAADPASAALHSLAPLPAPDGRGERLMGNGSSEMTRYPLPLPSERPLVDHRDAEVRFSPERGVTADWGLPGTVPHTNGNGSAPEPREHDLSFAAACPPFPSREPVFSPAAGANPPATEHAPAAPPSGITSPPLTAARVTEALLDTVAEKTGYPRDVLGLDMELEGELGIDSIKRVEILAALEARLPELPELPAEQLTSLNSLGAIIAFIERQLGASGGPLAPAGGAPVPNGHSPPVSQQGALSGGAAGSVGRGEDASSSPLPMEHPSSDRPTAERRILRLVERAAIGFAAPGLLDGCVGVTDDHGGVGPALVAALAERGVRATLLAGDAPPDGLSALILLDGLRSAGSRMAAASCHRTSFQTVRRAGAGLVATGGLLVVVQDTGGTFGLSGSVVPAGSAAPAANPGWAGGLSALAKTAALEWPELSARSIDIVSTGRRSEEIARALAGELLQGSDDPEIGLAADGTRRAVQLEAMAACGGELPLQDGDVVLVTGGGRGVTARCLLELARHRRLRLVLLGRTPLDEEPPGLGDAPDEASLIGRLMARARARGEVIVPAEARAHARRILAGREIRAGLVQLAAAGCEAVYQCADAQGPAALRTAVAAVSERWGAIHGVIHAAGVLADKLIAQKSDAQFDLVFNTKVGGLAGLLDAVRGEPLKCLVLFSSVAARFGNRGQCDYAMGNEVLNQVALAEARTRGPSCRVKSIAWGPWDSGMVTDGLRRQFEANGIALLETGLGAKQFVAELTDASPDAVVTIIGGAAPAGGARQSMEGSGVDLRPSCSCSCSCSKSCSAMGFEHEHEHEHEHEIDTAGMEGGHADLAGGWAPARASRSARRQYPVLVGAESYPSLRDHAVRGVPVLPVALTVEWFARAVAHAFPSMRLVELRDLRVLRGVTLPRFDDQETRLTIRIEPGPDDQTILLELRDAAGQPRYAARGCLIPRGRTVKLPDSLPGGASPSMTGWPFPRDDAYNGRLFHGPEFQVIAALETLGEEGGSARVEGVLQRAWPGPWHVDVAALDGCLQLPVLWGHQYVGRESLPTSVSRILFAAEAPIPETMACHFRVERRPRGLSADVLLAGADGRPLLFVEGAEMTVLPAVAPEQVSP